MGCSENCRCRPGVVAFVFVPGIMGTRLQNKKTGSVVWDPAAGMAFEGNSSAANQAKLNRQRELDEAQSQDDDATSTKISNWFKKRLIYLKYGIKQKPIEVGSSVKRKIMSIPTITDYAFAGPQKRKELLVTDAKVGYDRNDELLEVSPGNDNYFKTFTSIPTSQIGLKRKRGWGEVLWDSYGPFLSYLEQKESTFTQLYPGLRFPVFAVGYNWMLSNDIAGKRLKKKLAEFKAHILQEDNRGISEKEIKFVLLTHSMGGFASRAGMMLSGLESEIEGVIHCAMPTDGSPDSYKRMRCGQAGASKIVIGKNAADITAILGFCQGGLELLPNQLYKTVDKKAEWLYYQVDKTRKLLPVRYGSEIYNFYKQVDLWYSLIQPTLLAPELPIHKQTQDELNKYIKAYRTRIQATENFHARLSNGFHHTTTLIYNANPDFKSYETCCWQGKNLPDGDVTRWTTFSTENKSWFFGDGTVKLAGPAVVARYNKQLDEWLKQVRIEGDMVGYPPKVETIAFTLTDPTAPGDGVVHLGAGKNPEATGGLKKIPIISAKDHQNMYGCPLVREKVIVQLKEWLVDIHKKMGA